RPPCRVTPLSGHPLVGSPPCRVTPLSGPSDPLVGSRPPCRVPPCRVPPCRVLVERRAVDLQDLAGLLDREHAGEGLEDDLHPLTGHFRAILELFDQLGALVRAATTTSGHERLRAIRDTGSRPTRACSPPPQTRSAYHRYCWGRWGLNR